MNELLVKDILPELEKAPDVRQRIEEVRKKPAPSPVAWKSFHGMERPGFVGTFSGTPMAVQTTSSVLFNAMNSAQWNQYASLQQQFNNAQSQRLAQLQQTGFPMLSGGVNLRDEYDELVRRRTRADGLLKAMTNWFSK